MPAREIDISISPNGHVEVHLQGYKGRSCLDAVKLLEQVVGELKSQHETSEFYEPDEVAQYQIEQRH